MDHLPSTLILWDVDHTLIENGGVSKDTYRLSFELLTGKAPSTMPATDGRTDFQIMRELLAANQVDLAQYPDNSRFEAALIEAMKQNAPSLPHRGHALPGARDVLKALSRDPNVVQSVLTGNIEANAWAKLNAFDLDHMVDLTVGGYGSDNIVRAKLVDAARQKVMAKYEISFDESSTVLVGDTVRDVEAARVGGAKIIAVSTGVTTGEELREAGAHAVLDSLTDLDCFLATLRDLCTKN
jgi:phosphoglycolate phosphatase-like HAD superfamily hydrolase